MRTGKVLFVMVAVLAMAGAVGAETIWEIGRVHAVPGPGNEVIGAAEFPATGAFVDTFTYVIGTDDDPINEPSMPGYIFTENVCVSNPRPVCTNTTRLLKIQFVSECGLDSVTITYGRYGSEEDIFSVDGVGEVITGTGEQNLRTYVKEIAYLAPGPHEIAIQYNGGGDGNGHYIDYIRLEGTPRECPEEVELCAGQDIPMGNVVVTNDEETLYVTFNTFGDWRLEETHVAVGDIPMNRAGNPVPGRFPYACDEFEPMAQTCTATIPLNGLFCVGETYTVAAHAAVVEVGGDGCESQIFWASSVEENLQGTRIDGTAVLAARQDPTAVFAFGGSFFSLGFDLNNLALEPPVLAGGSLTVGFGAPVYNGPGDDIVVQEETGGRASYPVETAEVFGVAGGMDYFAGVVTNKDGGDGVGSVDLPGDKSMVDFVKVLDTTDPANFPGSYSGDSIPDGYDVNAIGACWLFYGEETAWGDGCEGEPISEQGNWGTQFEYTVNDLAPTCE